jgi:ABC-2 type transport system ATP-binding protein
LQIQQFRELLRQFASERTVLLSSHLLAEVEAVCDRVVLILGGRLVAEGPLESLRRGGGGSAIRCELAPADPRRAESALSGLASLARVRAAMRPDGGSLEVEAEFATPEGDAAAEAVAERLAQAGLRLRRLEPRRDSLEQLFLRYAAERRA